MCEKIDVLAKLVISVKADEAYLLVHFARNTKMLRRLTAQNVNQAQLVSCISKQNYESTSFAHAARKDMTSRAAP